MLSHLALAAAFIALCTLAGCIVPPPPPPPAPPQPPLLPPLPQPPPATLAINIQPAQFVPLLAPGR